ncbi:Smooth muscle protein/calponin [Penicillium expansum]|uniref:Smooth muscle protein/calponin n=1 Tax=Penicillium expansum TaxID=27334 RepID=A0A0A2I5Q0_PENEN|nr:Smooth muscle protein/calponin [Penicillium expansum]KGO37728.1 Smooth muscle protein/calponin [Penicillium expansum]KGO49921.1 Smooth muscle protein/calponin [Penicillium expansum]KGO57654.1 Smooth muscle protein/calponin [Penicillium expansum]
MASVTSLDKDLRNMRLSRYTPQAAAEVRDWIEEVLHEKLATPDLLEGLKDGVALCKLVNLVVSPGVKYKQLSAPFVQMENISHFLRACQLPPLNLPPHDVFLTVDLYEAKDPAQVLQCLAAFSRRANALAPNKFPRTVGPQSKRGVVSPNATGSSSTGAYTPRSARSSSNVGDPARTGSPAKSSGSYSTWAKKGDEQDTTPAWNIHQYGYIGGASQGNQGVAFGARRQITTPGPAVPSLAEKEKRKREEDERIRQQNAEREEADRAHQRQIAEEEAHAKAEEERRWEEETARVREQERLKVEAEKKRWDDEKRQWEAEEQRRMAEEKEAEDRFEQERQQRRNLNDNRLNGQFLSQYQASKSQASDVAGAVEETAQSRRIKELELELQLAKEREHQYETERQVQPGKTGDQPQPRSQSRPHPVPPKPSYDLSSLEQERRLLRTEWQNTQDMPATSEAEEPQPIEEQAPPQPPRPLPVPKPSSFSASPALPPRDLPASPRPLPDPVAYNANRGHESRVDSFLSSNPAPKSPTPAAHRFQDYTSTSEVDAENSRRAASQQKTKAGGWASKSLLEREMERERARQEEWAENQKQTAAAAGRGNQDGTQGSGPGQSWDVHQYGYMGGDNQNRGGVGLGVGGARRQIIGPRPPR